MPQPSKKGSAALQKITLFSGLAAVVIVAILVGIFLTRPPASDVGPPVEPGDFQLASQPALGSPDAPVKVVEFGDYKCPACRAFHEQAYPQLVLDYVDMNLVEFYFINFQFIGPDSTTAGIGGECVFHLNPAAFWDYFDAVYVNQGPESQRWATPERLQELVRQNVSGVDSDEFRACVDQKRYRDEVEQDKRIGTAAGVNSTPTLFVNGKKQATWSYSALKAAIEGALAQEQP